MSESVLRVKDNIFRSNLTQTSKYSIYAYMRNSFISSHPDFIDDLFLISIPIFVIQIDFASHKK